MPRRKSKPTVPSRLLSVDGYRCRRIATFFVQTDRDVVIQPLTWRIVHGSALFDVTETKEVFDEGGLRLTLVTRAPCSTPFAPFEQILFVPPRCLADGALCSVIHDTFCQRQECSLTLSEHFTDASPPNSHCMPLNVALAHFRRGCFEFDDELPPLPPMPESDSEEPAGAGMPIDFSSISNAVDEPDSMLVLHYPLVLIQHC